MAQKGEDPKARLDRELNELLQELRVVIPGVEILLAFLLTVPFASRFPEVTPSQKNAYFVAFLCATVATILLVAPTIYHRIQWRARDKEFMLHVSNGLAVTGSGFLAAAIVSVVFLVTDFLFGRSLAIATTSISALLAVTFWYSVPVYRRLTTPTDRPPGRGYGGRS